MTPQRIQLRRTKGWRKPEGAVVVSRPSKWGNPFRVGEVSRLTVIGTRQSAVAMFAMFRGTRAPYPSDDEIRAELAGRDLCCWCPLDQPCHADVLLEIANGGQS